MSDIYRIVGAGLSEGQRRLEAASLNAANASTPGYRRRVSATASAVTFPELMGTNAATYAPAATAGVDLREGQFMSTGRPLDVAISGPDQYFGLSDGQQIWLTRAGAFHLNDAGQLVGEGGLRVQGPSGDIQLDTTRVEVQPDGKIVQDGITLASLQLFRPVAGGTVTGAHGTLLSAPSGVEPVENPQRIRSGALESSNASANAEVLGLVTLARQYESLIRVTQGYDEVLGRSIQKLGDI